MVLPYSMQPTVKIGKHRLPRIAKQSSTPYGVAVSMGTLYVFCIPHLEVFKLFVQYRREIARFRL